MSEPAQAAASEPQAAAPATTELSASEAPAMANAQAPTGAVAPISEAAIADPSAAAREPVPPPEAAKSIAPSQDAVNQAMQTLALAYLNEHKAGLQSQNMAPAAATGHVCDASCNHVPDAVAQGIAVQAAAPVPLTPAPAPQVAAPAQLQGPALAANDPTFEAPVAAARR